MKHNRKTINSLFTLFVDGNPLPAGKGYSIKFTMDGKKYLIKEDVDIIKKVEKEIIASKKLKKRLNIQVIITLIAIILNGISIIYLLYVANLM